jgi:hypothetical protein
MTAADLTSTLRHEPDFAAVTEAEKRQGYSSRCRRCRRLLWSGLELLGSACPGAAE